MNTTPMATISKAEVERLKYELDMALRSEKRLLAACESGMKSLLMCGLFMDTEIKDEYQDVINQGYVDLETAISKAKGTQP